MRATYPRRGGFTLIELLVAVGIILVLAGLALLVANSGIIGNARTSSGSDRISGWFMQARSKAQRDGAPRGIRFIADGAGFVREAQLIEVPEPYTMPAGYNLMIENSAGPVRRIYVIPDYTKLPATANALTELNNNISVNDTLSIPSTGTIHRIQVIQAAPNVMVGGAIALGAAEIVPYQTSLVPDLGAAIGAANTPTYATSTFGFLRQARPAFGEPPLLVPDSIAIDGVNCQPVIAANGTLDVLFSPNGEVQNTGGLGRIVLWTRNPEALAGSPRAGGDDRTVYEQAGEMRLIVVYTKTGAVAVQPVAMPANAGPNPGHDPYSTTKDGIASGL